MTGALERRIAALEEQRRRRRARRCHTVWSEGPHDDGSAEIARRIAEGMAHRDDKFIVVRWLALGENSELAEQRKTKNDLERNRAADIGA